MYQDFEALTPNILCRTIETVEGGGIIVLLLKSMTSLKQLYTMTMVSQPPPLEPVTQPEGSSWHSSVVVVDP